MGKLEDDDKAFCTSHGLTYYEPDNKYITLEEFEAAGPYYHNQGPMQGEPQMWTPRIKRHDDDDRPADTTTSRSEWAKIGAVALILAAVAVMLAQAGV